MPVRIDMTINGKLDTDFSEATEPVSWRQVSDVLAAAELYWLTTVREDGRPHITPLIGAWVDSREGQAFVFCTGPEEQKAKNLAASTAVAVTTGVNTWNDGLDVVVEGNAERVTGVDMVTWLADTVREKYRGEWDFTPEDAGFGHTDASGDSHIAYVYRVSPGKVLAFAKSPHGQTTFRF
jgi:nitroimidazol reductase NimA-like FMN-containing flavoprotein (pyridoxamine 5'-phosphate oxidase superfamily)